MSFSLNFLCISLHYSLIMNIGSILCGIKMCYAAFLKVERYLNICNNEMDNFWKKR